MNGKARRCLWQRTKIAKVIAPSTNNNNKKKKNNNKTAQQHMGRIKRAYTPVKGGDAPRRLIRSSSKPVMPTVGSRRSAMWSAYVLNAEGRSAPSGPRPQSRLPT